MAWIEMVRVQFSQLSERGFQLARIGEYCRWDQLIVPVASQQGIARYQALSR
jgi:hypothetical protein